MQADDHPVVHVSHTDSLAFCRWLQEHSGIKDGPAYDLPTEPGMTHEFDFRTFPAASFSLGPFEASTAPVAHPVPAYAIRLDAAGRSLAYSGDTGECELGTLICIGGFIGISALWGKQERSILADFGLRLIWTGYVIAAFAGMADAFGMGATLPDAPYFGPLQAVGVLFGQFVIAVGFLMFIPYHSSPKEMSD